MCGCLSCVLYWGPDPATQAYALTGNRTGDPLVLRPVLNPLSDTNQGHTRLALIPGVECFSWVKSRFESGVPSSPMCHCLSILKRVM